MKTVEVHILTFNEEAILPYTLRHYATFATRIVVHDSFSTDATRDIAIQHGAEVENWDTGGKLNDELAKKLKNECWLGTKADWVIVADADELIYFPNGPEATLVSYDESRQYVIKPHGYEMYSEVFPTGPGQIYDEVKHGGADNKWYSKPILFSPKRVASMNFAAGAHAVKVRTKDGYQFEPNGLTEPPCWLLHCKHLGPLTRVAMGYDEDRKRLSDINIRNKWGNFEPGMKHATDKREGIKSRLELLFKA